MHENIELIFAFIFVGSVLFAMISDFSALRIPNSVSITLVAAFAAYAALGEVSPILPHLYVAGGAFVVLFVFFALSWMGAGDVKFLSTLMLWAGPSQAVLLMVLSAVIGGLFALMLIGLRSASSYYPALAEMPVLGKMSRWARNGLCPYGIPIGLAALFVAPAIFTIR